jgi:hypothetical protein
MTITAFNARVEPLVEGSVEDLRGKGGKIKIGNGGLIGGGAVGEQGKDVRHAARIPF